MTERGSRNIILLGAPGSGKGTQAARLTERLGVPAVSTGDIFRANIAEGTALGKEAKGYMDRGELVPDAVVIAIALDRIDANDCRNGFLLDGFPRTTEQADALDRHLAAAGRGIDGVLLLDVPTEELVRRISGRRVCRSCGASYHVTDIPPARAGLCDACDGALYARDDDNEETVRNRIEVYNVNTAPLTAYYEERKLLLRIAASGASGPDAVFADILKALRA
ncbi:MAG: adenylate kinase [Clostridiales Family XIII bacterium]|jgi:adenylate kinase|nr:adenylate kinase [Clostridiales Family XIII bacterium]